MTKIIAALDDSKYHDKITKVAISLAQKSKSDLTFLHIAKTHDGYAIENRDLRADDGLDTKRDFLDKLTEIDGFHGHAEDEKGQKILNKALKIAQKENFNKSTTKNLRGLVAEEISNNSNDADLIIIGKRGEDAEHHVKPDVVVPFKERQRVNTKEIGRNLEDLIRSVKNPILIVTTNYDLPFKKLVFAYDDSENSEKMAKFLAKSEIFKGAEIHLILSNLQAQKSFESSQKLLTKSGYKVTSDINDQTKVNEIVSSYIKTNKVDLIVAPAFVHNKMHNLILGSITKKLISESRTPMLLMS